MLLNTNLRRADSEMLRGYLHRYRRAPTELEGRLADSAPAYITIRTFLRDSGVAASAAQEERRRRGIGLIRG